MQPARFLPLLSTTVWLSPRSTRPSTHPAHACSSHVRCCASGMTLAYSVVRKAAMNHTKTDVSVPVQSALHTGPTPADLARIPAALKTRAQWVLWRGADRIDQ